jgi:hypothetical protein
VDLKGGIVFDSFPTIALQTPLRHSASSTRSRQSSWQCSTRQLSQRCP